MTFMALRRYSGLVNEQKLHENDGEARDRVVILTEYEDTEEEDDDDDDDGEYDDDDNVENDDGVDEVIENLEE